MSTLRTFLVSWQQIHLTFDLTSKRLESDKGKLVYNLEAGHVMVMMFKIKSVTHKDHYPCHDE